MIYITIGVIVLTIFCSWLSYWDLVFSFYGFICIAFLGYGGIGMAVTSKTVEYDATIEYYCSEELGECRVFAKYDNVEEQFIVTEYLDVKKLVNDKPKTATIEVSKNMYGITLTSEIVL